MAARRCRRLTGKIALLGRGICDFTVKVRNAQNAGAVGVIMVNRIPGEAPFLMSHNGLEPKPTIPAVMVSLEDGALIDDHDGDSATLNALGEYVVTPEDTNLMAGFSSQGPTHGDLLIKPDVVAPGADVISSFPQHHCNPLPPEGCWSFLGGTSMATPHLAGTAAVVRGAHPNWTAAQVRSAVVNTAQQGLLRHPETGVVTDDAQIVGAGLVDVAAAVDAVAALGPVSTSFGNLSSGSGGSRSSSVVITNISSVSKTFSVSVTDTASDGVTFATNGGTRDPGGRRIGDVQRLRDCGEAGRRRPQAGDPACDLRWHRGRPRDALRAHRGGRARPRSAHASATKGVSPGPTSWTRPTARVVGLVDLAQNGARDSQLPGGSVSRRQTEAASGTLTRAGDVVKWLNTEVCKTSIHRFESGRRLHSLSTNRPAG